jgi:beta-lactamase class D
MEQANTEYSVHSTSKILWTIIDLEEGLVNDTETFTWDSTKYPCTGYWPKEFSDSHTLETAPKYSINCSLVDL